MYYTCTINVLYIHTYRRWVDSLKTVLQFVSFFILLSERFIGWDCTRIGPPADLLDEQSSENFSVRYTVISEEMCRSIILIGLDQLVAGRLGK